MKKGETRKKKGRKKGAKKDKKRCKKKQKKRAKNVEKRLKKGGEKQVKQKVIFTLKILVNKKSEQKGVGKRDGNLGWKKGVDTRGGFKG